MPICKSCLKGFNSDYNICPHCKHEKGKRSYRLPLTIIVGLCTLYSIYLYSFQTITVKVDGKLTNNFFILQGLKKISSKAKNGQINFFHLFKNHDITVLALDIGETITIDKGLDTEININTKVRSIETRSGNFLWNKRTKRSFIKPTPQK